MKTLKTQVANPTLADLLDQYTTVGTLGYAEGDRLRCVACGHRCLIGEGKRGICKVRYNEAGQLKVPFGYVAGLQCDPVEKKPFFHVYPGSDALTFGMMGCDLHCSYCFPGDTPVLTNHGPVTLAAAFASAPQTTRTHDAEIAFPEELRAVSGSGTLRKVRGVFKHRYCGQLTALRPLYLPALRCTPDHRLYATTDPDVPPQPIKAGEITTRHYLAIPRNFAASVSREINVAKELEHVQVTYRVPWKLSPAEREQIVLATARGETSRQIGETLGKSASYVRHVRSKTARGRAEDTRTADLLFGENEVRFPNEHRPGIPRTIPLDSRFARLLGLYCAEGCVTKGKKRPNSLTLNFSFSHREQELVQEVCTLLEETLGLRAYRVTRSTTLAVAVAKASGAMLFKQLAGGGAAHKRVPAQLFDAPREIVMAFLNAYLQGDGHRYPNGKISATTVSRELAYGIAFLALKLGFCPSIYDTPMSPNGTVQGRAVRRSPHQYTVVWYETSPPLRKMVETEHHYLIPLRDVSSEHFAGDVYNMEVEEEHNYLAGLFLVSNCQNWVTSQALRDSAAAAPVRPISPAQLVEVAQRERARLVVSSYNEPLITAEWAVAVFEQAKQAGLECAFVSNGNATPEVLDFLKPWIVAYKVDLKSFDDRHYRSLGGTLSNITDTIRMVHERGIWLEVVTLVIPGFNDSEAELREMARFLASVDRDIPWHVTAFHKDYRMTDPDATPPRTLIRAVEMGAEEGLRFIYAGNLPGRVGPWENTRCPSCGETVIERYGYLIRAYRIIPGGFCPGCGLQLPGIWPGEHDVVRTGNDQTAYMQRLPRPVAGPNAPRMPQPLPLVDRTPSESPPLPGDHPPMATAATTATTPRPTRSQRPEFTAEQKQHLLGTAVELVRSLAAGRPAALADPTLGGAGEQLVAGAFVSLKRGKHLRSCCGMLGQPIPLQRALQEAAARTVAEDVRFPPISPTEVNHLDLEVWLLHSPEPVRVTGEDRVAAVTVGRHGIQVMRGDQRGLLLPGVAVDHQWDSRRFLDQVCVKAGLPPSAWREDTTALFTFEGEVLRGPLGDIRFASGATAESRPSLCRPEDVRAYADFCCTTIDAMMTGGTPSYFCYGAPDGTVSGLILTLAGLPESTPGADAGTLHLCQISLRPGVPLQSTLFALSRDAAQTLAQRVPREALANVRLSVAVLHDPVLHGTVAEPDLAGMEPGRRAILVMERHKSGVVFDPARQPAELLAHAARQARVTHPAGAAVFSLEALAQGSLTLSTAPRAVRGPAVRPPAVAGQFYPREPELLARMVDGFLEGECTQEAWSAAMVPHAGLIYSGRIAARVLRRLKIPRTVIVLGPKHTPLGVEWAVAPHQTWSFPGGQVESDFLLARQLAQAIPGLELDAQAHQREHAIEVELPLLARLAPESRVVGIALGAGDLESCRRFARCLAEVLRGRDDWLLLISSDMNHFATDAENRRLDALALAVLERLDPAEIYETITTNNISMCGLVPAVIVLETLRQLGRLHRAEHVAYATSADVTGDPSRVVGYAGMLFG